MFGAPDWSSIVEDIWIIVLGKLSLEDLIRCRSVCTSWFFMVGDLKRPNSEPPWLMLPPEYTEDLSKPWRFLDIAHDKIHEIQLPELKGSTVLGSSDGWLVVECRTSMELRLFNPLSRVQIQLPPITSSIRKVYLSISSDCCYTVVVDIGFHTDLYFTRSGNMAWTRIDFQKPRKGIWRGTLSKSILYMLDNHGQVLYFDLSFPDGGSNPRPLRVQVPPPPPSPSPYSEGLIDYLAVLPGSDTLLLLRLSSNLDKSKTTVFKLEHDRTVEVKNLGGHSLFMNQGICGSFNTVALTCARGRITSNCVYTAREDVYSLNMLDKKFHCIARLDELDLRYFGRLVWVARLCLM